MSDDGNFDPPSPISDDQLRIAELAYRRRLEAVKAIIASCPAVFALILEQMAQDDITRPAEHRLSSERETTTTIIVEPLVSAVAPFRIDEALRLIRDAERGIPAPMGLLSPDYGRDQRGQANMALSLAGYAFLESVCKVHPDLAEISRRAIFDVGNVTMIDEGDEDCIVDAFTEEDEDWDPNFSDRRDWIDWRTVIGPIGTPLQQAMFRSFSAAMNRDIPEHEVDQLLALIDAGALADIEVATVKSIENLAMLSNQP